MPKSKINSVKKNTKDEIKEELKETPLLDDEDKAVDPELIIGGLEEDDDVDDIDALDDDEVDPFKDKWEE